MSSTVLMPPRALNPAAKEFIPTRSISLTSINPDAMSGRSVRRSLSGGGLPTKDARGKVRRGCRASRSSSDLGSSHDLSRRWGDAELKDGESRSVSPRGQSSLASSSGSETVKVSNARNSFKSVQQLKVHAPGCDCQRLRRTREELGQDSGYLVTSRDARTPDVHFGTAYGFGSNPPTDDASRRNSECRLATAIASSEMPSHRVSCAACLLDGHWRNGAVCLVGPKRDLEALCRAANADKDHKHLELRAPGEDEDDELRQDAVLPALDVVLNGDDIKLSVCAPEEARLTLLRCVVLQLGAIRRSVSASHDKAEIVLPILTREGHTEFRPVRIDVKHHILEALEVVSLDDSDHALCLTYVDNRGVVSLDFPGGKRRLAETAWEAAARETADQCALVPTHLGDAFHGTGGILAPRPPSECPLTDAAACADAAAAADAAVAASLHCSSEPAELVTSSSINEEAALADSNSEAGQAGLATTSAENGAASHTDKAADEDVADEHAPEGDAAASATEKAAACATEKNTENAVAEATANAAAITPTNTPEIPTEKPTAKAVMRAVENGCKQAADDAADKKGANVSESTTDTSAAGDPAEKAANSDKAHDATATSLDARCDDSVTVSDAASTLPTFSVRSSVDGQSVRFFVLRAICESAAPCQAVATD